MIYAATIFLSSFLLFLVQPLIARLILPWFGGSAAVWTTCMLFFQVLLLAGYAYAHALGKLAALRRAGADHAHPIAPRRDGGPAVFPARLDQPADPGMVRARPSGREPVPALRAVELCFPHRLAGLPVLGRAGVPGARAGEHLVVALRRLCAAMRGSRLAHAPCCQRE